MIAAVASIAAVGAFAAVESPNIVGYVQRTVVPGSYNMMAIQFNECGSDADYANLGTQITTDLPLLDYADCDLDDCPQIWLKTSDTAAAYNRKFYYCEDTDEGLDAGWWRNGSYAPTAQDMVDLGRGFWLVIPDDTTIYDKASYSVSFNGQVADMTSGISVPVCNGGYIIASNPFPKALDMSKIVVSSGVPLLDYADCDLEDCPQIWIKTSDIAAAYNKKFYYCEDTDEGLSAGWWRNGSYAQAADDIPAGKAFWIVIPDDCLTSDSETFTFNP